MTRVFIALEMHEQLQSHLARVIRQMAQDLPALTWVNPNSIHLTLAFLGEVDDAQLAEAMQATLASAQQVRPFAYHLTRVGIFGTPRQPRVLWMGIEEKSGTLVRLHRILNQELQRRGFATDERPFAPHLTLARVKKPPTTDEQQRLQAILASDQRAFMSKDEYLVKNVNVMKSELLRSGAHYTCLQTYALA